MKENNKLVQGYGGGKGGGAGRVAQEAKNTLKSIQNAEVIDLISEGEIEGLVAGEQSIFFNNIPLENEDGTKNFSGYSWELRPGTQNQTPLQIALQGGKATKQNPNSSTEIKYGPVYAQEVTIGSPLRPVKLVDVTINIPALTVQDKTNGDLNGGSVSFSISYKTQNSGFITEHAVTIKGKCTSPYYESYEIPLGHLLPEDYPVIIRVTRISPDATGAEVADKIYWSSYTEHEPTVLSYPNSAVFGISIDAQQFSSIPTRGYEIYGIRVKVPNNYDPIARTYTGAWDGTFKVAWTNNPAWIYYDLATETRYGLGGLLTENHIDKWALYPIAKYCDELVPSGFKNNGVVLYEPRFTCNTVIAGQDEAYNVLSNIASIFRAMQYWAMSQFLLNADMPKDAVAQFSPANVIDGAFNYSGSSLKTRHTVAQVTWNDPADGYKQKIEYVEDIEAINKYGIIQTDLIAIGCTSQGQAHRLGKWLLYSEQMETETIAFKIGIENAILMPGDIIQTSDPFRSGQRLGGRIQEVVSDTVFLLDGTIPNGEYDMSLFIPYEEVNTDSDGTTTKNLKSRLETRSGVVENNTFTITATNTFSRTPAINDMWLLIQVNILEPEYWRVISITEDSPTTASITALEYRPDKFAAVEGNLSLSKRPTSLITKIPGVVTNLSAKNDVKNLGNSTYATRIIVSWTAPESGASKYHITWIRNNDNPITTTTTDPTFDIDNVAAGTFKISVQAENLLGILGQAVSIEHLVDESYIEGDVQNLRLYTPFNSTNCTITWDEIAWSTNYTVQVYNNSTLLREELVLSNKYVYDYATNVHDGGPYRSLIFKVKANSWRGTSANWVQLTVSNPAPSAPTAIHFEEGPGQVNISADLPDDIDLRGMIIWMYTDSSVPTTQANIIYSGLDNSYVKSGLEPGIPVYFKLAFYDSFGTSGLNISSSFMATPTATGGIVMTTSLPADPNSIAGQTAVFLDVPEASGNRGLWGWDGTQWAYTRNGSYLVANSVTADKINANRLSAISANLGTITAGNFTLDSSGFIKGGAISYTSGTGIWMGYDNNAYKFRVGSPTSSRMEWTGTSFNIYDTNNNLTISSGVVDWEKIGGNNKPANNATRNVFIGAWAVGISYSVGDIVTYNGNSWSCIQTNISSALNAPPISSQSSNIYWSLYAASGLSPVSAVLTNDAHVLPADSLGSILSYNNSGTEIRVYEGADELIYDGIGNMLGSWKVTTSSTNITPGSVTSVGSHAVYTNIVSMPSTDDIGNITYTITGKSKSGVGFSITKVQSFSKAKAGIDAVTYNVEIQSTNGNSYKPGQVFNTTLVARVFKNDVEVTDILPASSFRWRRVSYYPQTPSYADDLWNNDHISGYKSINLSISSVNDRATYYCDIQE